MTETEHADELRHCLTVVSGYVGLALDAREDPPGEEFWLWLRRAQEAAAHAAALMDVPSRIPPQAG